MNSLEGPFLPQEERKSKGTRKSWKVIATLTALTPDFSSIDPFVSQVCDFGSKQSTVIY